MSGPISTAVRERQSRQSMRFPLRPPSQPRESRVPSEPEPRSPTTSSYSGITLLSKTDLRVATKGRKGFAIFTSCLFLLTLIFLILVQIGNTSNNHVLGDLYFFKMDVSNIVPSTVPTSKVMNTAARSLGLHDFYQVGMWNFCEGYNDQGITACSKPMALYWFNPVQIILDELMSGKVVELPDQVTKYLVIIRGASQVMFVCFFATTFTSFLLIFLCPLAVYSKLTSIPIAIFSLISALMTTIGTIIATAMWSIFKKEIASYQSEINIVPTVGRKMYVFIWIATGCSLLAAVGQIGMLCCGTSRRDIKSGRRVGRKQRTEKIITMEENPALRRRWWGSVSE